MFFLLSYTLRTKDILSLKYYISHILFFSHTVRRKTVRKSEVREMPSLPRGGGEELVRDEQVSSRKVCWSAVFVLFGLVFRAMKLILVIFQLYCRELSWHSLVAMALNSLPANLSSELLFHIVLHISVFICMGFVSVQI